MTSRERLLKVLDGGVPDCVPVAPDFSNMIPARLTGKPFWQLYLYNDPPIWEAYIDCAKYFDIDAVMDGYFPLQFPEEQTAGGPGRTPFIVSKNEDRIVVQESYMQDGKRIWCDRATVYYAGNPPNRGIRLEDVGLPAEPSTFEPVEGVKPVDRGPAGLAQVLAKMGDQGLVGVNLTSSLALHSEQDIFQYYDHPDRFRAWARERVRRVEERFERIMGMETKPDFLCVGGSGTLIFQTVDIFRQLAFPAVKRGIELATAAGFPTHLHSCGPEAALVKIMAEETDLTVIDPLEIPPMGDCDLAELKRLYGDKIVLKGNLHTTNVMLHGSPEDVAAASRNAVDAAAAGGGFILSTGDQCGRDTPDENLRAMVETARTYGQY